VVSPGESRNPSKKGFLSRRKGKSIKTARKESVSDVGRWKSPRESEKGWKWGGLDALITSRNRTSSLTELPEEKRQGS